MAVQEAESIGPAVLKVTVKGYTGSDGSIFGDVRLRTEDGSQTFIPAVSVENGVITYTVESLPTPGNYQWVLNDTNWLGYLVNVQAGKRSERTATYCTVNFKDGNDILSSQYVKQGNTVTTPDSPQKDGYTFSGWVTEDGGNTEFDFSQDIQDVTDVYASWTEDTPTDTNIAYGTGWVLDKDGVLTIQSNLCL